MKWVKVESAVYSIQNQAELTYRDILQLHKVKCVNNTSDAIEFPPVDIKFIDGKGTVVEHWQTKGHVEAGEWHWEVELKPGEY